MLEDWIDDVTRLFGRIPDGRGGQVLAYRLFEAAELPEALTTFPCAVTYPEEVVMTLPDGGPNVDMWKGITELHLAAGKSRTEFPNMIQFFSRVRYVFSLDRTLGGKVQYCKLTVEGPSIEGPVIFNPNTEITTQGLTVHWVVRERLS